MARQKAAEKRLTNDLLSRSGGLCEDCGSAGDFRGLAKHEIRHRSQGGDPLDPANVLLLCGRCHSLRHGIREVD